MNRVTPASNFVGATTPEIQGSNHDFQIQYCIVNMQHAPGRPIHNHPHPPMPRKSIAEAARARDVTAGINGESKKKSIAHPIKTNPIAITIQSIRDKLL